MNIIIVSPEDFEELDPIARELGESLSRLALVEADAKKATLLANVRSLSSSKKVEAFDYDSAIWLGAAESLEARGHDSAKLFQKMALNSGETQELAATIRDRVPTLKDLAEEIQIRKDSPCLIVFA